MLVGRQIWVADPGGKRPNTDTGGVWIHPTWFFGPFRVLSFKQLLHAGPIGEGRERKRTLVQLNTDPGGIRTLAVANIWSKDPSRSDNQW